MIRENEDRPYARGGRAGCASACRDEGEFALIDRPRGFAIAILLLGAAMPLAAQQAPALAPMPVAAATPSADVSEARARALAIVAEMTLEEKLLLVHGLCPPKTKDEPHGDLIQVLNEDGRGKRMSN